MKMEVIDIFTKTKLKFGSKSVNCAEVKESNYTAFKKLLEKQIDYHIKDGKIFYKGIHGDYEVKPGNYIIQMEFSDGYYYKTVSSGTFKSFFRKKYKE
jgi:hypothetical protein